MRLLAVFLVLMRHLSVSTEALDNHVLISALRRGGWVGVDLFFVLSGFLVSSLLFVEHRATGSVSIKRFLVRRGFKIYPAFWLFIACSLLFPFQTRGLIDWSSLVGELLFLQNYIGRLWVHTWSLAVEEHFYFGLAIIFAILAGKSQLSGIHRMPWVFLLVGASCLILRFHFAKTGEHTVMFYKTHFRIDSLFFGVLISYYWNCRGFKQVIEASTGRLKALFLGVGISCLAPAFVWSYGEHSWQFTVGHTLYYCGAGALLVAMLSWRTSGLRWLRVLGLIGAASYPIYLWHMAVNEWVVWLVYEFLQTPKNNVGLYIVCFIVGSLAFGYAMHILVDTRVSRYRERWFPKGKQRFGS